LLNHGVALSLDQLDILFCSDQFIEKAHEVLVTLLATLLNKVQKISSILGHTAFVYRFLAVSVSFVMKYWRMPGPEAVP
jgi:hypothetical protein